MGGTSYIMKRIVTGPHTVSFRYQWPRCRWFDHETNTYSFDGCSVDTNSSTAVLTVCVCDHLTDFNVKLEDFMPTFNLLTMEDIERSRLLCSNSIALEILHLPRL
jgi:hypothetical protein